MTTGRAGEGRLQQTSFDTSGARGDRVRDQK